MFGEVGHGKFPLDNGCSSQFPLFGLGFAVVYVSKRQIGKSGGRSECAEQQLAIHDDPLRRRKVVARISDSSRPERRQQEFEGTDPNRKLQMSEPAVTGRRSR